MIFSRVMDMVFCVTGCLLLVTGCLLLVAGHWALSEAEVLVVGLWSLGTERSRSAGYWLLVAGHWALSEAEVLVTGCWLLVTGH